MSTWAWVVLAVLLAERAVRLLSDVLTVRSLAPEPPPELRDVVDAATFRRMRSYTRSRTGLRIAASGADLTALLGFWLGGGFGWLDRTVRMLDAGPVATGLAFLGVLALGRAAVALPFAIWSTFGIEARFGFNRTRPATFVADRLKALLLAIVIGGPLLAGVLHLFATAGGVAWLWVWGLGAAAVVAIEYVAPAWLLPLFSRFTPLPPGALRDAILDYARGVDFPLAGVFVVDGSRRTTKANAFFAGFGRQRRIALFDTLLATLDPPAVVAVVAHEVGHWKLGHVPRGIAFGLLHLGAVCFLLHLILGQPGLLAAFGIAEPSAYAALAVLAVVLPALDLPASVLLQAWSRRNERAADRFAVRTTGDGAALARGLERLAADSLTNPTPHPLAVWLDHSHPPVVERIRALAARG